MSRLGVSDRKIIEEGRREDCPEYDDELGIKIVRNNLDPHVIVDGIDRISVVEQSEDRYIVDYWGYTTGYLLVTREGVKELGGDLLGDRSRAPRWVVRSEREKLTEHDWIPDDYEYRPSVVCDSCGENTAATEILTPGGIDDPQPDCYCRDCWEEMDSRR